MTILVLNTARGSDPDRWLGGRSAAGGERTGAGGGSRLPRQNPADRRGSRLRARTEDPETRVARRVGAFGERGKLRNRHTGGAQCCVVPERDQCRERDDDGAARARPFRHQEDERVLRHRGRRRLLARHRRCGGRGALGAVPEKAVGARGRRRLGDDYRYSSIPTATSA